VEVGLQPPQVLQQGRLQRLELSLHGEVVAEDPVDLPIRGPVAEKGGRVREEGREGDGGREGARKENASANRCKIY